MNYIQRVTAISNRSSLGTPDNLPFYRRVLGAVWDVKPNTSPKYRYEVNCIQQAIDDVSYLEKIPYSHPSYDSLFTTATKLKQSVDNRLEALSRSSLQKNTSSSKSSTVSSLSSSLESVLPLFKEMDDYLTEEIKKFDSPGTFSIMEQLKKEKALSVTPSSSSSSSELMTSDEREYSKKMASLYRLSLTKNYFHSLEKLIKNKDVILDEDDEKLRLFLTKFIDCFLVGNSSERLQGNFIIFF
jgi:hypothetical protein